MEEDFVVPRIPKRPPCKTVLRAIRGKCKSMPDIEPLGLPAVERLEDLHQEVVRRDDEDPLRVQFVDMLVRLWKITYKRPILVRLAKCDTIAQMIGALQVDIDGLARGLGRADDDVGMTKWRSEWKGNRAQQFSVLQRLTMGSTDRQLVFEIKNQAMLEVVMAELKNELGKKIPEAQLELKQKTLDRVSAFTKTKEVHLSKWLISANDLVFDEGPCMVGSFGEIRRGTWYHDGASEKVVVKQILSEIAADARGSFTRQLNAWRDLPEHPNILKLHGGCNVGSRQFYVCEVAAKGNLREFCSVQRSSVVVWRIMIQVAEGLGILHQHGIVHGGLTCNNILIDADNCPKLSDFGFSTIRSLSMGMSVSRYHFQPQQPVGVIDGDSATSQRIESDIYALGACISEALERTIPFGDGATDTTSDEIRRIISRLCAANYQDRPSIEDSISLMRSVFPEHTTFPIEGLPGSPSSVKVLTDLSSRCRRMPENEKLCRQVLERLQFLHASVWPLPAEDPLKAKYTDVVVRFTKLMRRKPLLLRLASSETLVTTIRELQLKLSDVAQGLDLADKPEVTKWEQQWEADRHEQFGKLNELVTGASERMLVNEFRGDKKVQEALMNLNSGMKRKDQTSEMLKLMQQTFARVSNYINQTGLRMFDWFIPIDDIEYEDMAIGNRGTFGDMLRGTWIHDGERTKVMVKWLFPETSSDMDDGFLRQLELWWNLPDNERILRLYGGSHISSPQFYVCENAKYGNLADLLDDDVHCGLFWQFFKQVAEGLKFLHSHGVVHDGLKCSNILVGTSSVKLADFGVYTVRTRASGLVEKAPAANVLSVRWKPREVVLESSNDAPRFESDIYSLGMCMIEAKTHEIPYGMDDDMEVLQKVLDGERPDRPDGLSDAEWDFISRLCDPELSRRPTLDEILHEITEFALQEEENMSLADFFMSAPQRATAYPNDSPKDTEPPKQSSVCSSCTESSDGSARSCRCCGFPLKTSDENITRHSFATYVKFHTKDDALQRVYDIAITLQDLREQGIVHANVVPGSIRIGRDGCAQLVGFECSKTLLELAHGAFLQRQEGVRYLAPECLSGKNPSFESDVYSLGMCAIYALTTEPPWGLLATDDSIRMQVCSFHAIPERPEAIRDSEWNMIKQMCTYDPADRMHIADVARQLAQLASKDIPTAPGWSLSSDMLPCPNDGTLISRTPFVSHHLAKWGDAVVAVHTPREAFIGLGRSFGSVADLWYSLKHPGIHELYGAYDDGKKSLFVCENAERGDFSCSLGSDAEGIDSWKILLGVALALHYMHCRGIVHGDVGLHNILVTSDGRGKLSGFLRSCQRDSRPHSPEDEPSTEEEWRPPTCSLGHHVGYSSDVYWLGQCIVDAIGGQSPRCKETPSVSYKCALCLMGQLPPQPESATVEEWRLVSDMCRGEIGVSEVVDRLARLAAVNAVVCSRLKTISAPLPPDARQRAQEMMLATVRQYEEEDTKKREDDDQDGLLSDDDDDGDDYNSQNALISVEQQIDVAAGEVFDSGDFVTRLMGYGRDKWGTSAIPPSHLKTPSVAWRSSPLYKWTIDHDSIVETGGVDKISSGGFASVWRGKWLGAPVALKKLSKLDHGQNLREEANLWFRVRHPHIVGLYGACSAGSQLFVCDFVEGGRLDEFCRGHHRPDVIWGLLHEAAVGLHGLHSFSKIVHADLKCDNILVTLEGRAKLIDFGLSCLSTCDGGKPLGAPRWKAPECLKGGGPTFTSDVFSFGMCILQAITGTKPWGDSMPDVAVAYHVGLGEIPKQPPAFSFLQWELVKRMCRFEPDKRLKLDVVVKVLGYFAKRAPYVDDQTVLGVLTSWERESQAATP